MSENQKSNQKHHSFLRKSMKALMWFLLVVIVLLFILLFCLNAYLASNKTKVLDNLKFLNNGVITFEEANISVFRNFPSATLSLKNVIVKDSSQQQNTAILLVNELKAALTIQKLFKKQVEVNSLALHEGTLNISTDKNGQFNIEKLLASKSINTTTQSRDPDIKLVDFDLLLSDMILNFEDQLNSINYASKISHSKSKLKKNGADWDIDAFTSNSTFQYDDLKKQNYIEGQIGELHSVISTNQTNWNIDLDTKNTDIQYSNRRKNNAISGKLNQFKSKIVINENELIADTEMNIYVDEFSLKKSQGSFIKNSTLAGSFQSIIKNGQLDIAPFDLKINEEEFLFEAMFKPKVFNKITLESDKTRFAKTISLLPKQLQNKISPYRVEKPFYSKTTIQGSFTNREEPLITIDVRLPNNKATVLGNDFKNVKLSGQFINRLDDSASYTKGSKSDFKFKFNNVSTSYRDFILSTKNALLTSTKANGLELALAAKIHGKASSISDWFGNDQFFFEKGTFELSANIDSPFKSFNDILIASNASIRLHDFSVWYQPANVSFPFEKLDLAKQSGDANFTIVNSSFVQDHEVLADGILKNINALLFNEIGLSTESDIRVVAKKLSWIDFINLFGQNGYLKNEKQKTDQEKKSSMKETIRGMYYNFQPSISLDVDTLAYYDILQLENFNSGVYFQDQNTLILEKTSFDYDRGSVDFSAKLDISKPDKTPFEFELATTNLNLKKLLPAFDFFNIKLLEDLENLPDDVKIQLNHKGIIDDQHGLITNTSTGEIVIESQAHNGTFATISYHPNEDQTKLKTKIDIEGDPSLFNEFFGTEQFFFSEGRFSVQLNFLGDLKSKEQLMTEAVAIFAMHDAYVYYKPVDVNFPLKQVDLNLKQDKADFSFFVRSDSMDRQILFEGEMENFSEIILGNTGKTIKVNVNVHSPILEWDNFVDIFMPESKEKVESATASKEVNVSKIKETVRGLMRTFNPTINLKLDRFIYSEDLTFDKLKARLFLKDTDYLVLDNTSFDFHEGKIQMNGKVDLDKKDQAPFETIFLSRNVDIAKLIKGLDYLNLPSVRSIKNLSGTLNMDFDFKGTIAKGGKGLINEETVGVLDFTLRDLGIAGFPALDTVATKMRMKRRFDKLQFATLSNQLSINGNEIDIPLMEIQSNALSLFAEGKLSYGYNTNIWFSFPTSNLRLRDYDTIPAMEGYAKAGKKLFIEVTSDDTGANRYKFRLRKKWFYKTRGIPEQFRQDRKKWRKERRELKRR